MSNDNEGNTQKKSYECILTKTQKMLLNSQVKTNASIAPYGIIRWVLVEKPKIKERGMIIDKRKLGLSERKNGYDSICVIN
jgi:hypothetical protein